jgi:hypothetical protein
MGYLLIVAPLLQVDQRPPVVDAARTPGNITETSRNGLLMIYKKPEYAYES